MLLEVTVEALDNGKSLEDTPSTLSQTDYYLAGVDRAAIKKSETGVWVGSFVKGRCSVDR